MEPTQLAKPEPVDRLEAFTKVAAVIKGWNPVWRLRLLIGFQIPATIIILALSRVNSIYAGNFNSTWCFVAQIIILLPLVLFSLKKIEYTDVNQKRNLVIERASLTFLGFTIVLGMIATINYMLASNERDLCFRNQQLSGLDCSAYTTPLLGSTLAFGFTQAIGCNLVVSFIIEIWKLGDAQKNPQRSSVSQSQTDEKPMSKMNISA